MEILEAMGIEDSKAYKNIQEKQNKTAREILEKPRFPSHKKSWDKDMIVTSDFITIRTVHNGWVVVVGPSNDYEQGETMVFNHIDDMCEILKELYKDDLT